MALPRRGSPTAESAARARARRPAAGRSRSERTRRAGPSSIAPAPRRTRRSSSRTTPSRPRVENSSAPARQGARPGRRSPAAGHQAADRQHRLEVGGQPQVQRQPHAAGAWWFAARQPSDRQAGRVSTTRSQRTAAIARRSVSSWTAARAQRVGGLEQHRGLAVERSRGRTGSGSRDTRARERAARSAGRSPSRGATMKRLSPLDDQRLGEVHPDGIPPRPCARTDRSRGRACAEPHFPLTPVIRLG